VPQDVPFISLIIPLRNEEAYIADCLRTILAQDYPIQRMEILFVDGGSTDGTLACLREAALRAPQIRVLDNPRRTVPYAMNIGIRESRGEYIVRMDAHAEYAPDYVSLSIAALRTLPCDNAGGVCEARGRGYMGQAIAGSLTTVFGVGNSRFRLATRGGYVDTVPFGAFRRALFDRIGLYDERLTRNQDNELNYRIRKHGGKIYLDERIRSIYYCRDTLRGLMRMGFQNGSWNVVTMYLCPGSMGLRHFVPLAFLLATLGLPLLWLATGWSFFGKFMAVVWGAYLALDAFYAYVTAEKRGWKYLPVLPVIYPAFHFSYGVGSLCGLLRLPALIRRARRARGKGAGD
jgi:glycosyltransferase involved in cell wall biosynthesis